MASLFEIDNNLMEAINAFEETMMENEGEITDESENLKKIIDELVMDRNVKIENIALYYKNLEAEMKAVDEQKKIFDARKKALTNKMDRMENLLEYALNGEKFSTPKVTISYRKSSSTEIDDENEFIKWAEENDHKDLLTYKASISKTAIKEALNNNEEIKGARIVEKKSMSIK